MATLTEFTIFTNLPQELQDEIWKVAVLDADRPPQVIQWHKQNKVVHYQTTRRLNRMFYRYDHNWIWMWSPGSSGDAQIFDQDIDEYFKENNKGKDKDESVDWSKLWHAQYDGSISCFEAHKGDGGKNGSWRERYSSTVYTKP